MHILYTIQTRTHPGKVRDNNEDARGTVLDWQPRLELSDEVLQQRGHLFAVADGMGGHAAGEVASQIAIETLFSRYYTSEWENPQAMLNAAILAANRAIWEKAKANARMSGMGTTLVAALYLPEQWLIANVGDSRAYLFRDERIRQVTQDHSWVAEQVANGIIDEKDAAHHPLRNVITRSLGNTEAAQSDFFKLDARPGDIVLLCSDGLSNMVSEKELREILKTYALDEAAERLLALALERGAPDNVTFALIQLVGGKQRRARTRLPWLALLAALALIAVFVYHTYHFQLKSPASGTIIALATLTPTATVIIAPTSPPAARPSPTPAPLPTATAASVQMAAAGAVRSPLATPAITPLLAVVRTMTPSQGGAAYVYAPGVAEIEAVSEDESLVRISIISQDGGKSRRYSATLPRAALDGKDFQSGSKGALAGRVRDVGAEGVQIELEPTLLLASSPDFTRLTTLWQRDSGARQQILERFHLSNAFHIDDDVLVQIK